MNTTTSDIKYVSFERILTQLRNESSSEREKGEKFERLMKDALPLLKPSGGEIQNIWLWREWAPAGERQDTGIDLVTELKDGSYRAIQCKFHESGVMSDSLSTFINKAIGTHRKKDGREIKFESLMVVTTSNTISRPSEDALRRINTTGIGAFVINKNALAEADIDWGDLAKKRPKLSVSKKTIRPHQEEAIEKVTGDFAKGESRGQMLMACGTGKTFISLKIVEKMFGQRNTKNNGAPVANILFCVPSIALLSQALRDYSNDMESNARYFAVCSDRTAGNKDDDPDERVSDIAFAPTTCPERLAKGIKKSNARLNVIFSTYHSLDVITKAQQEHSAPDFDFIICDEAHRTTGHEAKIKKDDDTNAVLISEFGKVHCDKYVKGKKRLYMTATPRVYGSKLTETAIKKGIRTFGMDDKKCFGEVMFRYSFGRAVSEGILSDYCVHILGVKGEHIIAAHRQLQDGGVQIDIPDVAKMVGIRQIVGGPKAFGNEYPSLKRLLFFASRIPRSEHLVTAHFPKIVKELSGISKNIGALDVKMRHVDGKMSAAERNEHISWLRKNDGTENETRALSNVRCLSEGVDIPALDGVIYYDPRRSIVDIVQSLGRVMRKDPLGRKEYGHIIIPICMPDEDNPEDFLSKNKAYADAWKVLQALRSHDDRIEEEINLMDLNNRLPSKFNIHLSNPVSSGKKSGKTDVDPVETQIQLEFSMPPKEWMEVIKPIWVEKVGSRQFLKMWAKDVGQMAVHLVAEIMEILKKPDTHAQFVKVFGKFRAGLKTIIGDTITEKSAAEMLAQHILTKPIFDVLFDGYQLSTANAISKEIDRVEETLLKIGVSRYKEKLRPFYKDVALRVQGVDNLSGRRTVLENIYAEFFKEAFPATAESSGVVYTPQEAVDFILHGANAVLHKHFNKGIADKNVHVLDPFTGCGRFIVRLLDSSIIKKGEALQRKYEHEIHANELLLLPFYIAMVNIEQAYHEKSGNKKLVPFQQGILADTFAIGESGVKGASIGGFFGDENQKIMAQSEQDIQVIVSNPPYFAAGGDGVSVAAPGTYPKLDKSLQDSFIGEGVKNQNRAYDSSLRAMRWCMDRIKDTGGVIGFVTNGSFLDTPTGQGVRKTIAKEMSVVYVLNLRGNVSMQGEAGRMEGDNIFGMKSQVRICIILMVKKITSSKDESEPFVLYYHDIGDYKSQDEKLTFLDRHANMKLIDNVPWKKSFPDEDGNWIVDLHPDFDKFLPLTNDDVRSKISNWLKKQQKRQLHDVDFPQSSKSSFALCDLFSMGVATNRDAWTCNFSHGKVAKNMRHTIDFYNDEVERIKESKKNLNDKEKIKEFVRKNNDSIKWTSSLLGHVSRGVSAKFQPNQIREHFYRPFARMYLYHDAIMNHRVSQTPVLFTKGVTNPSICISGKTRNWGVLACHDICNLNFLDAGAHILPFYSYANGKQRENISDHILKMFRDAYGKKVSKWDIFHYAYGVLNHPQYQTLFAGNLRYAFANLPMVKAVHFSGFVQSGKKLMDLHINYENATEAKLNRINNGKVVLIGTEESTSYDMMPSGMKFFGGDRNKLQFNSTLIFEISSKAHAYKICGRSPLEWVVVRYKKPRSLDNDVSGIMNDPKDWEKEQNHPGYILSLVKKSVTIGEKSVDIIAALPPLEYDLKDQPIIPPPKK